VVRVERDRALIRRLPERVRACGAWQALLLCTDDLRSDATPDRRAFREPQRAGRHGRPRLVRPAGLMQAQVVERYARRRVIGLARRAGDRCVRAGAPRRAPGDGSATRRTSRG
jgi:hypothetical protein